MLISNDVQSNQAEHRQRRLAADQKARVERASNDAAVVREGAVRQAGEAPSREEVAQFRGLMQTQGREPPKLDSGKPAAAATSAQGEMPKFDGELASMSTAERFRTLMQRAFATVGERKDDVAHGDHAPPSRDTAAPTQSDRRDAAPRDTSQTADARKGGDSQRTANAERQPSAKAPEHPMPRGDAQKSAVAGGAQKSASADDSSAPNGKRVGDQKGAKEPDAIESAQALARKAADGETQVGAAARSARNDDESQGDGMGDSGSQAGVGSAPTPTPTDMALPSQPQRMPDSAQQAQTAAASGNVAPALAELVQKHVRQMLVSDPRSSRGRSREVLLRMQNDVLPGTDLWLTQTSDGWQLRADVRSRDAYDTLLANQDDLIQRFADGALGKLSIEPVFHG